MIQTVVPGLYAPDRSLPARVIRRVTQWRTAAPLSRSPGKPIISFTFDDFPKSAAEEGAAILESAGMRATYYAASGLTGMRLIMGDMYTQDDVRRLLASGHEIGSHTRSHQDCTRATLSESLADIEAGDADLLATNPAQPARQFAYPFGETTFQLKRALAGRYESARGILPGINRKGSDRAQLRAIELGDCPQRMARAFRSIRSALDNPGWVIFFTHDVRHSPSAYGISPVCFREVVEAVAASGADVMTVGDAMTRIEGGAG